MSVLYRYLLLLICSTALLSSCENKPVKTPDQQAPVQEQPVQGIPDIAFNIVNAFPHDTASFTEGLEFRNGELFESTGTPDDRPYKGWVGKVDLTTGRISKKVELDLHYFGEGITFFNDKLIQLTWQSKVGFVYDAKSFRKIKTFDITTEEGWALTHDSTHLMMSDGTEKIYFLDPSTQKIVSHIEVTDDIGPVFKLNELEYINGYLYANQFMSDYIFKIDPKSGKVVGRMDLTQLANEVRINNPYSDVLNGIAYNKQTDRIYITGKRWPKLYEIKFAH